MGEATAQARQPRPVLAALAATGILGPVVFAVVAVVQGLLRPGYSFVADPVVAPVAGPSGWVQDLNFVVLGAAVIAFAIALHLGVRPTRWAVLGSALFALSGGRRPPHQDQRTIRGGEQPLTTGRRENPTRDPQLV